MSSEYYNRHRLCGCWYAYRPYPHTVERKYLPQVELKSSTTILATTSRTTLKQTFVNNQSNKLDEVQYTFPLYDGMSVVGFTCTVGSKTIVGVVKEKQQARVDYQAAIDRGETAGLLEQLPEASDVFTTTVGNVPANQKVHIEIVYLGELKYDAETDGSRFTLPTIIAPRYGSVSSESTQAMAKKADDSGGISISVDVTLDDGTIVRGLQSPSHPIAVTMGRTSSMDEDAFSNNQASASLTLGTTELDQDFVVVVLAKGTDTPRALLEAHPTIPNQRAIMATLVPKFNIPNISPEVVFVVDRSGSMQGKIELVVSAMKIFLKSLPIGVKFNICSFGSRHTFLFRKSKTYDQSSLKEALSHLDTFSANYGGTEMLQPVKETVKNRYKDLPLEVMLLTDGEIWNQDELFKFVNETPNARFFTLGIGSGASSALVEGIARAGNGFAQFVGENEKMDKRVVRMLKGALTPHIIDYTMEIAYDDNEPSPGDDDFEMVDSASTVTANSVVPDRTRETTKKTISLFDSNASEEPIAPAGRYDSLPQIAVPKVLQAPQKIPALYPFNRTTAYLLLGPDAPRKAPKSIILRGTSEHGPLELEIPIQNVGVGETIHQLAAKKAVHELEQGRGWITDVRDGNGKLFMTAHEGKWDLMVEREAVRLGVMFQVGGKWCSFVAVEQNGENEQVQEQISASQPPPDNTHSARERLRRSDAMGGGGARGSSKSQTNSLFSPFGAFPPPKSQISTGSSLFGAVSHVPSPSHSCHSGGLFGSIATAKPASGGGLFGSGPVVASASACFGPAKAESGGFGASIQPSRGTSLFGNASEGSSGGNTSGKNTGTLFGARSAVAPNPFGVPSLFQPAAGSLFGTAPATTSPAGGRLFRSASAPRPDAPRSFETSATLDSTGSAPSSSPLSLSPTQTHSPSSSADSSATDSLAAAPPAAARRSAPTFLARKAAAPSNNVQLSYSAQPMQMMAQPGSVPHVLQDQSSRPNVSLADYQSSLMILNQQNKSRKQMIAQPQAAVAPPPPPPAAPTGAFGAAHPKSSMAYQPPAAGGGSGFGLASFARRLSPSSNAAPTKRKKSSSGGVLNRHRSVAPLASEDEDEEDAAESRPAALDVRSLSNGEKMLKIIDLQEFDGSWLLSSQLLELIGLTEEQFAKLSLNEGTAISKGQADAVRATALAIGWLKTKVPQEEDVWEMVVEKAKAWLAAQLGGEDKAEKAIQLDGTIL